MGLLLENMEQYPTFCQTINLAVLPLSKDPLKATVLLVATCSLYIENNA